MNEITLDNINHLSDIQLTKLLHALLRLEAYKYQLQEVDYFVPLNITVSDGGSDGRIQWNGIPPNTYWIKNKFTIFQNKATALPPAKCTEELLEKAKQNQTKRKLKAQIEELVLANGCYVLFTNKSINDKGKTERIKKFREAIKLAGHTNYDTFQILVYDSNSIKDWVNEYIAAVTLVQGFNSNLRPLGFMIWEKWEKYSSANKNKYHTNKTVEDNIKLIQKTIKDEWVIRITGHSGLGKTRLVLEAFRDTDLGKSVVYYNHEGSEDITTLKDYIISHQEQQNGIIVIDNCSVRNHNILSKCAKEMGKLKIISIGPDDDNTIEDFKIKIERNDQRDIVKALIQNKIGSSHQPSDIEYINILSEGYPGMAILFCDKAQDNKISELNGISRDEFTRKLIFGLGPEKEIEHDIIRACSVFSAFGFLDGSFRDVINEELKLSLKAQMKFIRTRIYDGVISETRFMEICHKFHDEDILEKRGVFYIVKPTILAINLATNWLTNTDSDRIIEIIQELKEVHLDEKFVERLKDLDQIDRAKDIVGELWGPQSSFGTAEVLNTTWGSLLFRYVVEVNPITTARTLEVAFGNMSKQEILQIVEGRRNLVWALEKLCFRKETFHKATKILYSFAVSETETWANNSTSQFMQLFQLFLSGTEASLEERLKIIQWGLNKNDVDYTTIAIQALGRGLIHDNYFRMSGSERQGSSAPLKDNRPELNEISKYWQESIKILTYLACSNDSNSELAKEKITYSIRSLLRNNEIEIIKSIKKIIEVKGNLWPDALNNLKITLNYEKYLSRNVVDQINELIQELTPTDTKNQLYLKVTKPEWESYEKDEGNHYIDKPKINAEAFAEKIINENVSWIEYIPDLLVGEQRQAINFGKRIAELSSNVKELIDITINELKKIEKEKQNPELLGGMILGAKSKVNVEDLLDCIILDEDIRQHAFFLTKISNPQYKDIEKLFILVDKYGFSINQFNNFQYGRAIDELKNDVVIKLCNRISKYGNSGKWTALSILFMYCFESKEKRDYSASFFEELISSSNMIINNDSSFRLDVYHWSTVANSILEKRNQNEFAIIISKQIVEFCDDRNFNYSFDAYLTNVIKTLFDNYFNDIWEYIGMGILSDFFTFSNLKNLIGTRNGYPSEREGMTFKNPENYETIILWCKKNTEVAAERIANMMPLSVTEGDEEHWHPFSRRIIDEFGDNINVLKNLSSNMGTFGTVGSSVPYYETQKKLLLELIDHKHENVKNWAEAKLEFTRKALKIEQLNDEQMNL